MRFLVLLLTICTMIAATAPAEAFVRQNQPMTGHKPAPIPQGARNVRRPYHSSLNPSRPLRTPDTPAPRPDCAAVCVIDPYNGNVLYGYNANTRRQVASTQKIITALCVCDTKDLDKMVTIKASDRLAPPIRLNLKAGEQYSRRDLLQAMLTGSFNDVAVSLARDCAGSVEAFVARMNARAKRMRMHNTHFANPNGLPAQQYSTAYDMALAACYAYNNKTIRSMINIPAYELRRNNGSVRMIRSTNRLLTSHPWVQGMKTGYTNLAGKCLISCASSGGRAVIVVVLGSTSRKIWGESLKYLRWALTNA
ncbi:MAG: D-alanyl-D-alanine carboxypeptidase [Akkermansia sp.]|nr:D-alanyl-D-alanine carboxypeptidase [Akkermansia sp.]